VLLLLRHAEDVVSRELAHELGVIALDVGLDLGDELGVAPGPDRLPALAVDDLRHSGLLGFDARIVARRACGYLVETLASESGTRIQLCGRLVVEVRGKRLESALPGRQGRLLLVYLTANRTRPLGRDELADALWPANPPGAAEASLSALLSKLRRVLGAETLVGKGEIRLVLPPDAWVDLEAAGAGVHRAESAVALREWTRAWAPARTALYVANRGFLPGEDAPWIEERRRWLEDVRLRALECIAAAGLAMGGTELAAAERSARTLVELAPFRESGYRLLMESLAASDNAAEAIRVYDGLRRLLRDELGIAPGAAAQDLHRRLLARLDVVRPGG
jgi:SARP family transcriptional regulator, regulator of embCAB operon